VDVSTGQRPAHRGGRVDQPAGHVGQPVTEEAPREHAAGMSPGQELTCRLDRLRYSQVDQRLLGDLDHPLF
jgi:hypothetical protein